MPELCTCRSRLLVIADTVPVNRVSDTFEIQQFQMFHPEILVCFGGPLIVRIESLVSLKTYSIDVS
jgi:hypothetical protein